MVGSAPVVGSVWHDYRAIATFIATVSPDGVVVGVAGGATEVAGSRAEACRLTRVSTSTLADARRPRAGVLLLADPGNARSRETTRRLDGSRTARAGPVQDITGTSFHVVGSSGRPGNADGIGEGGRERYRQWSDRERIVYRRDRGGRWSSARHQRSQASSSDRCCWKRHDHDVDVDIQLGHFEYRSVESSVNPYLSFAALLAAMKDGIERSSGPGPNRGAEHLRGDRRR